MKTILSLILLFVGLFIMDAVFPYKPPCEQVKEEKLVQDTDKTVNLANYTALEDHQVARFESGAPYDFSHDFNLTPVDDPALSDGTFDDNIPIEVIEPSLNFDYEFNPTNDFYEIRYDVAERTESLNSCRHQPHLHRDECLSKQEQRVVPKATP